MNCATLAMGTAARGVQIRSCTSAVFKSRLQHSVCMFHSRSAWFDKDPSRPFDDARFLWPANAVCAFDDGIFPALSDCSEMLNRSAGDVHRRACPDRKYSWSAFLNGLVLASYTENFFEARHRARRRSTSGGISLIKAACALAVTSTLAPDIPL